jgi:hypothetical protein
VKRRNACLSYGKCFIPSKARQCMSLSNRLFSFVSVLLKKRLKKGHLLIKRPKKRHSKKRKDDKTSSQCVASFLDTHDIRLQLFYKRILECEYVKAMTDRPVRELSLWRFPTGRLIGSFPNVAASLSLPPARDPQFGRESQHLSTGDCFFRPILVARNHWRLRTIS